MASRLLMLESNTNSNDTKKLRIFTLHTYVESLKMQPMRSCTMLGTVVVYYYILTYTNSLSVSLYLSNFPTTNTLLFVIRSTSKFRDMFIVQNEIWWQKHIMKAVTTNQPSMILFPFNSRHPCIKWRRRRRHSM